jgi:6-phosphogluconolactonase (cycloisomerase 2 family)
MRYRGCIRPAVLGRAVFLAIASVAFAAAPALAQHHGQTHHHHAKRHHNVDHSAPLKAVYTEDNLPASAGGNHVLVFARGSNGTLPKEPSQVVSTGGVGLASQPPFAFPMVDSQGALDITSDGRLLFAVNAGSNSISAFKVTSTGAHLVDTIDSGGTEPISLTHSGHLLYVLNEDSGNIAGFHFSDDGDLSSISHSSQSLATPGVGGVSAQIGFSPDGRFLTVTERCFQGCPLAPFGLIDTFRMGWDGRPGPVQAHASDAPIPFGFAYQGRHLITTYVGYVATPSGATPNPADPNQFNGFIGSDTLNTWGGLSPNGTVPAGGAFQVGRGTCWIAITGDGKYAFVTNSLSDTVPDIASGVGAISRVALTPSGHVSVLQPLTNASPDPAPGPAFATDLGLSSDSKFLYVAVPTLNQTPSPAVNHTSHIDAYSVGSDGSLTPLGPTNNDLAGGISGIVSH